MAGDDWERKINIYKRHLNLFTQQHLTLVFDNNIEYAFLKFYKFYILFFFEQQNVLMFSILKVRSAKKHPAPQMTKSGRKMLKLQEIFVATFLP